MKQKSQKSRTWRGVIVAAGFLFATSALFGQAKGVPASVTSFAPGHGFNNPPGVPASVLSPGPKGFATPNFGPFRGHDFRNRQGARNGRFHGKFNQNFPIAVPIYSYPYGYYDDSTDTSSYDDQQSQQLDAQQQQQLNTQQQQLDALQANMQQQPVQQQRPQIIVIDNRGVHDATPDERAALGKPVAPAVQPSAPVQAPEAEDSGPASVIVFLNGTHLEIRNYAIVGKELIDLTGGKMRRYQLSDLNVPETIKENNGRGVDFKLPKS